MKRIGSVPPRESWHRPVVRIALRCVGLLVWTGWALLAASASLAHGPTIELLPGEMKPGLLNLFVGSTVHFSNTVEVPSGYVVVDEGGALESPKMLSPGDGWHYTFDDAGTFEVFIREAPEAKAKIVVIPKP